MVVFEDNWTIASAGPLRYKVRMPVGADYEPEFESRRDRLGLKPTTLSFRIKKLGLKKPR